MGGGGGGGKGGWIDQWPRPLNADRMEFYRTFKSHMHASGGGKRAPQSSFPRQKASDGCNCLFSERLNSVR